DAAPGLIQMRNGLAVIDYSKNDLASPAATRRCPTNAIVWVEDMQFMQRPQQGAAEIQYEAARA
ncbi:MAG TPA: hypothetical protein VFZ36_09530, partial [Vicinamibacterales bacterium]